MLAIVMVRYRHHSERLLCLGHALVSVCETSHLLRSASLQCLIHMDMRLKYLGRKKDSLRKHGKNDSRSRSSCLVNEAPFVPNNSMDITTQTSSLPLLFVHVTVWTVDGGEDISDLDAVGDGAKVNGVVKSYCTAWGNCVVHIRVSAWSSANAVSSMVGKRGVLRSAYC